MKGGVDSVTLSVIGNHLVNICWEMGTAMMRTAYSPIFSESRDFSCVMFDRRGRLIAQAEYCPAQIGAVQFTVGWVIQELGLEAFEEGDVVIHNDPYRGGCHIPEHTVLKPVFHDGELFGFVANIAHVAEIGGMTPGGMAADATDIFQEGLRLPPVKIMRHGEYVKDIWKVILTNHRTPERTWGDFHAMIGSLTVAERRLKSLIGKYGREFLERVIEELIDYAERRMRAEIRAIPDGEYSFEDCIEDDGVTDRPARMKVAITVKGDDLIVDFTGTDPQTRGPANATYGVTASATYNAIFHLTESDMPRNAGSYRPITIVAPPGTMVNVQPPGPDVGGNSENHPRIVDMIFGAMAKAIPERVAACSGSTGANFLFGGIEPGTHRFYADCIFEGMGWGGRLGLDGHNATNNYNGNCRNTPIEVFETRYPWRVRSLELVRDSGGPGRFRGGLGSRRILEILTDGVSIGALFDRMKIRPWGLFGGEEGGGSGLYICRRGQSAFESVDKLFGRPSPTKFTGVTLDRGDLVMFVTPGGGGYGNPRERDPEAVRNDVLEGYVSRAEGERRYGVVFRETVDDRLEVATAETESIRRGSALAEGRRECVKRVYEARGVAV